MFNFVLTKRRGVYNLWVVVEQAWDNLVGYTHFECGLKKLYTF